MNKVFLILKRDIMRLLKAPAALVVVLALLVFPSLYSWYNIVGFWNPYDNTGSLRICVVNLDEGASSELVGTVNIGQQIVGELSENMQVNWCFGDYDTALAELRSGKNYAVFVIPETFSANLLSVTTGSFERPVLHYYVNEKTGPVATKITDTVSSTLEESVNSEFIAAVSDVLANVLDEKVNETRATIHKRSSEALDLLNESPAKLTVAQASLESVQAALDRAQGARESAETLLARASDTLERGVQKAEDVSSVLQGTCESILAFSATASEAVSKAQEEIAKLRVMAVAFGLEDKLEQAEERLRSCASMLSSTSALATSVLAGQLQGSAALLDAALYSQQMLIVQANIVLDQTGSALSTARAAVEQTDAMLRSVRDDLGTVRTDVLSLANSQTVLDLLGEGTVGAASVASFMGSPTTVVTEKLFPLNAYGSGMAPLFMNLTIWIGAFMLIVVMRLEVDDEGVRNLTVPQRYLARFLLFAILAACQAVVCTLGVLALGVQAVSPPALLGAVVLASLAYLSVVYALSVMFQHVGMGLCIILVFLQIPSATGLYPLELMAEFYQVASPFFPFTYGIQAMREAICGFYGSAYAQAMGVLALFLVSFLVLGKVLHPFLSNVNRTFARQIRESGLFNGETVQVPERRVRAAQIIELLSDKADFRAGITQRYTRFLAVYPLLIRCTLVVGFAVPVLLGIVFSFNVGTKALLLGLWLAWLVLLFVFLTVVENMRNSLERQLDLVGLSEASLKDLYKARQSVSAELGPLSAFMARRGFGTAEDAGEGALAAEDAGEEAGEESGEAAVATPADEAPADAALASTALEAGALGAGALEDAALAGRALADAARTGASSELRAATEAGDSRA